MFNSVNNDNDANDKTDNIVVDEVIERDDINKKTNRKYISHLLKL